MSRPCTTEEEAAALLREAASSGRYLGFAAWLQSVQRAPDFDVNVLVRVATRLRREPGITALIIAIQRLVGEVSIPDPGTRVRVFRADADYNVTTSAGTVIHPLDGPRGGTRVELDSGEILVTHAGLVEELDATSRLGLLIDA